MELNLFSLDALRAQILVLRGSRLRTAEMAKLNLNMRWAALLPLKHDSAPTAQLLTFVQDHPGVAPGDPVWNAIATRYHPFAESQPVQGCGLDDVDRAELSAMPPSLRFIALLTRFE